MTDAQSPKTEVVDAGPKTFSLSEAAKAAGVTTHAVRKAVKAGRMRRCNAYGEPLRFTETEVQRYIAARESGGRSENVSEEIELAKADSITNLVSQAHQHTESFGKLAIDALTEARQNSNTVLTAVLGENKRLQNRVDKLEELQDQYRAAIEVLQKAKYDETIAQAEAAVVKRRGEAALEVGKLLAPAVLARLFGGEELNSGAFQKLILSMTDMQRDQAFQSLSGILTPDQQLSLGIILSKWEAKETAEKTAAAPHDTERPPVVENSDVV